MAERPKTLLAAVLLVSCIVSRFSASFNPYYYDIILTIGINIILAVSLNLINGHTGQFSLGHAGFMAVGAYTAAAFTVYLSTSLLPRLGGTGAFPNALFFLLALIVGGLAAALAGLIVGVPSLRLKGDYLAIVTLGFGQIIVVVIENIDSIGASRGLSIPSGYTNFLWTFGLAAITVYVVTNLVGSTYGRGFLTVRDDEIAAEAMGIDTTKYKVLAFTIGSFFAGIAGGLYAHFKLFITPDGFGFLQSVDIVVMVILGGMGNTAGVIFAAVLLTILPEWLRKVSGFEFLPHFIRDIAQNRMILYSLLLIILMLTRPQGLFGDARLFRRHATKKP
jgi:branched-chain amino acid transport system permease protein